MPLRPPTPSDPVRSRAGASAPRTPASPRAGTTLPTGLAGLAGLAALVLGLAAFVLPAATAAAADSYRFWGFFQQQGRTWTFATKGADQVVPADGAVDGWRLSVGDMTVTRPPRATLTFDEVCGAAPAQPGKKRVGVVLDFGRAADNEPGASVPPPRAQCAVVDVGATSQAVLASIAPVRAEKGMVCAVEDTPAGGCAVKVTDPPAEARAADTQVDIPVLAAGAPADPAATSAASDQASPGPSTIAPSPQASGGPTPGTVLLVLLILVAAAIATWLSLRRRGAARTRSDGDPSRP